MPTQKTSLFNLQCLDSQTLTDIYATDWKYVFPALVYRRVSNSCLEIVEEETSHGKEHVKPSSATGNVFSSQLNFLYFISSRNIIAIDKSGVCDDTFLISHRNHLL